MDDNAPIWEAKRQLKILANAETDPQYGRRPAERSIEEYLRLGAVNLDKPPNPSSSEVVAWVKRILGVSHAGHGGTLEAEKPGRPDGYGRTPHHA